MTLRLVQKGNGHPRVAAFFFLVGFDLDARLREALGPDVAIVVDGTSGGTESMQALLAFAKAKSGAAEIAGYALIGFSAGCQKVRALLGAGADPCAAVAMDGTSGGWPLVAPHQVDIWKHYADRAKRRERLFVATHTLNLYTERLASKPFAATRTILRRVTGFALDATGDVEAPVVTREGDCIVASYTSGDCDAAAHGKQQQVAMPLLLKEHVAPWLAGWLKAAPRETRIATPQDLAPTPTVTSNNSNLGMSREPLGVRALALAHAELAAGIHETPGNADTKRILEYSAGAERSGAPVRLSHDEDAWCACFASWCAFRARIDGEPVPHRWRVSVRELWSDAVASASARDTGYRPQRGDLAVFRRQVGGAWRDPRRGDNGHVARVDSPPDGSGAYTTVDGNHGNAVALVKRTLRDEDLVGWIAYPQTAGTPAYTSPEQRAASRPAPEGRDLHADVAAGLEGLDVVDRDLNPENLV